MSTIKVMGHVPPDTDSTCSPIAYAWFLKNQKGLDAQAYIGGNINREAEFVLKHFNVETPELINKVTAEDKLVIVDTNNPEELISGWSDAELIEIVDHHKLYGLQTSNIPTVTVRPYGCVATVIWEIMQKTSDIPAEMAGLLCACILSDTLKLTSPTTTDKDREAVSELSALAKIDVDKFASDMFAVKSNLEGMNIREVLLTDAKDFDFSGKVFKLAVLETTGPDQALSKTSQLKTEMLKVKDEEGLTGIIFFVVDILNSVATAITASGEDLVVVEKAFGVSRNSDNTVTLPGIVSRKKQIVPAIEKILTQ